MSPEVPAGEPAPAQSSPTVALPLPTESVPIAPPPTGAAVPLPPPATPWGAVPVEAVHHPGVPVAPERPRRRGGLRRAAALVGIIALSGAAGGVAGATFMSNSRAAAPGTTSPAATGSVIPGGSGLPTQVSGSTDRPTGSVAQIAATALPSVVTIRVKDVQGEGTGSGFVIDTSGHILTNNHVVSSVGSSGAITIQFSDGSQQPATVVGRDVSYDLAVVKVSDAAGLAPLLFGRSADVVVGDGVIAVGAPLGLEATVTTGIVSALGRPVTAGDGTEQSFISAIQTDAAINPGNSGGPLLDMSGHVIGVNSAIARIPGSDGGTGGSIGLGFAIPSDKAHTTAQQLISDGTATHPIIGVSLDTAYDGEGVRIASSSTAVTAGGPADLAGVQPGDVILRFEGRVVSTPDELVVAIRAMDVGDTVELVLRRDGAEQTVTMTLVSAGG